MLATELIHSIMNTAATTEKGTIVAPVEGRAEVFETQAETLPSDESLAQKQQDATEVTMEEAKGKAEVETVQDMQLEMEQEEPTVGTAAEKPMEEL